MPETARDLAQRPGLLARDKNFTRLFGLFILLFICCALLKPESFLRVSNFVSMAKQFPEFGLMSIGVAVVMLTGGIDLSIVNVANLSAVIAALILRGYAPRGTPNETVVAVIAAAVAAALGIGVICGIFNGILVSKIGIPAILATLGSGQLFMGLAIVATGGRPVSGLPIMYSRYGNKSLWGIFPVVFLVFMVCALAVGLILSRTTFGVKLYMLGANAKAAVFSGLKTTRIYITTYVISAVLGLVAGLIMMARSNSAKADYGVSYTMQSILIAVLGGVSPSGGKGNVSGVVMAVFILQLLSSALNMFENISNFYRDILWGVVMVGVLIANYHINARETWKQQQAK